MIPLGRSVAGSVPPTRAGAAFFPAAPAVKPTLLYISPVVPALTGNGLAMRAGAVLLRLAEFTEGQARLKQKIVGTMIYPAIMLVIGGGVLLLRHLRPARLRWRR